MPKGEQRGNRAAKKPKKEKARTSAAAPSTKGSVGAAVDSKPGRNARDSINVKRREFIAVLVDMGARRVRGRTNYLSQPGRRGGRIPRPLHPCSNLAVRAWVDLQEGKQGRRYIRARPRTQLPNPLGSSIREPIRLCRSDEPPRVSKAWLFTELVWAPLWTAAT